MNVLERKALTMVCPVLGRLCQGTDCMAWQWDVPMMLNPPEDAYIADPPPTGHCGMTHQPEVEQ